jgi:hypothetical protein
MNLNAMCGRFIQVSGPLRYKFVDGLDVPDSRLSNIPRRALRATMRRSLDMMSGFPLDVRLVSYGTPSRAVIQLAGDFA